VLKRIADWLEKISAGSMLIGLFQGNFYAAAIGALALLAVLYLQWKYEGK